MEGSPNHSIMFIMAHMETQTAIIGRNKETNEILCCALNEVKYYSFNMFSFFSHWLASKFSQAHLKLPRFQTRRPPYQPYLWPVACTIIHIITIINTIIIILSSSSQHQNYDHHRHHLRQHRTSNCLVSKIDGDGDCYEAFLWPVATYVAGYRATWIAPNI